MASSSWGRVGVGSVSFAVSSPPWAGNTEVTQISMSCVSGILHGHQWHSQTHHSGQELQPAPLGFTRSWLTDYHPGGTWAHLHPCLACAEVAAVWRRWLNISAIYFLSFKTTGQPLFRENSSADHLMDTNKWMSHDSYPLSEFIIELHSDFLRTSWADKLSH